MKMGGGEKRLARLPLLIVCIAGLGTAHILVRTATDGAVIEGGAVYFLSTARNFLAGEGWQDFAGEPMRGWPPLFPLLLAAFDRVGIDPVAGGRWVHAAAFGWIILAAGLYLHSNLRSRLLVLTATVVIATSLPLAHFASHLETEPLFVLLTLLALIQLASFLSRGARTSLWWAAVCTALAALTRYPGVVLIGVGVLLLLGRRTPPLVARLKDALAYGTVSSVPLAGVLMHNWATSGGLTGRREMSGQSLSDGLSQIGDVFGEWVVLPNTPDGFAYLLWLAVGLVGLAGATVVLRVPRPSVGLGSALPFGGFALAYLVFMVAVVPFTVAQGIDSRYLLPIYVPLLLAAVLLLDRFLSIEATGRIGAIRSFLTSLVLLGACAHVGFSVDRNLHITRQAWTAGNRESINSRSWEESDLLHYIRDNPINGRIFSDNAYLAWFWSRTAAPGEHHFLRAEIHNFTSAIGDGGHVLWFRRWKPAYDFDELDIRVLPGVETVAELSDGVVFRVTAAEPFDEAKHHTRKQRYVQQLIERAGELVIHADSTWPISTWGVERTDEQVARAGWNVYRTGRKLTYHKYPCTPADVETNFVLQVSPDEPAYLSADRRQYGYDHLDFYFYRHGGIRLDDQCVVTAQLPDYPISRLYIGRWMAGNDRMLWEMKAEPLAGERHPAQRQRYAEQLIAQTDEQVARAGWGVYRTGRKLIYRKQPCAPADVQAKFILHVTPADPNELPANRQRHGFESLGFHFDQRGFQLDDQCIAIAQLPAYAINRIRVGQWIADGNRTVWEAELSASR